MQSHSPNSRRRACHPEIPIRAKRLASAPRRTALDLGNRFDQNHAVSTGEEFARCVIDCLKTMHEKGAERPNLMPLPLRDRLTGISGAHGAHDIS
jgi:hypothetical protein